jgi:hypothetical protein
MHALGLVVLGCAAAWGCAQGVVAQGTGTGGGGASASSGTGPGSTSSGVVSVGSGGSTTASSTTGVTVGSSGTGGTGSTSSSTTSVGSTSTVGSTSSVGSTGSTGSTGSSGAGGSVGAGGGDPYNTPVMCSSNVSWTGGNNATMRPGESCDKCHVLFGAASGHTFDIAGTVYPTAHEPDDCDGANVTGAQVIITDATGMQTTLAVNSAGNFYHDDFLGFAPLKTPYTAKVTYNGKTLRMISAQTVGDCNSCHTESGTNSAPGRIILPP